MRHLKGVNLLKVYGPGPDNDWSFMKPPPAVKNSDEGKFPIEATPEVVEAAKALLDKFHTTRPVFLESPEVVFNLANFFDEKAAWSRTTFGPAYAGVLSHLEKEFKEVAAEPSDLEEWVDIVALALDGASRHAGATGAEFVDALQAKHQKNLARRWLKSSEDGVMEHDRSEEAT